MTSLEIILSIVLIIVVVIYIASKIRSDRSLEAIVTEIKGDLQYTLQNVSEIVKNPILDEIVGNIAKELMLIVEEKNVLAKKIGESTLTGREKKNSVITGLTELVRGITGSDESTVDYMTDHLGHIENIIEDYVSFSNKMMQHDKVNK